MVASCYPLHPLAAAVLPDLCNRYGQHERTLFSFLTSADPASAASYLNATELPSGGALPSLGLAGVYDYFVASGTMAGVLIDQSRWTEIATRLRDAPNLTGAQMRLAKAVAILNLVSTTGVVRASKQLLTETESHAGDLLPELEAAGIVTYRDFSDEYRIWQGTDVDIPRLLASARTEIQQRSLVGVLSEIDNPKPVVAGTAQRRKRFAEGIHPKVRRRGEIRSSRSIRSPTTTARCCWWSAQASCRISRSPLARPSPSWLRYRKM